MSSSSSSILAGRLAGKEAAYFLQESKHAVTRLADKLPKQPNSIPNSAGDSADVLPEILRHSLPARVFRQEPLSESTYNTPKWALEKSTSGAVGGGVSADVMNPLRGYLSLPQVTFGPKRWQLPTAESSVIASTANDLRREHYTQLNPEKIRAAAEGLTLIGKAFAIATAIIFGSAALTFGVAALKLDIHNGGDIQAKGKNLFQPKMENIKERLAPLREWAENTSKKWHLNNEKDIKERPIIKELSKMLGAKSSS